MWGSIESYCIYVPYLYTERKKILEYVIYYLGASVGCKSIFQPHYVKYLLTVTTERQVPQIADKIIGVVRSVFYGIKTALYREQRNDAV